MLDIVGNIKIDESKSERVDYFIACLKSWEFFKDHCAFYLYLESPSDELLTRVNRTMGDYGYSYFVEGFNAESSKRSYGKNYMQLLKKGTNPFVLNFIEDHFTILDDPEFMKGMLNTMHTSGADVLKSSFFKIEQNSSTTLKRATVSDYGKTFLASEKNHHEYQRHYGSRYYLGVNFITKREFALKFWDRNHGPRPHEYEISTYSKQWEHTCMIPSREIQCAVDDDHGEEGTCLMARKEEKWERIFNNRQVAQPIVEEVPVMEEVKVILEEEPVPVSEKIIEPEVHRVFKNEELIKMPYLASKQISSDGFFFNDLKTENDFFADKINARFSNVLKSGTALLGKQTMEMEERLAKLVGKKYCIAVKNGTDALIIALKCVLTQRPNAKVILPNFGAYPTAIAVKNCTDNIHFVDVDASLTIDVTKLPEDVRNGVIIPVHLFGNNCNMKQIRRYAEQNDHIIIEDCAQSLGSGSGQHGEISCFSFYPTKPLGTIGDGGAICTDSEEAFRIMSSIRFYGMDEYKITHAGINSRMGELECAVVNAKMYKFQEFSQKRMVIASRYKSIVDGIRVNSNCIFHQFTVLFNEREKVILALQLAKIPFMIHYTEHISNMPVFSYLDHKVGFQVSDKIISLPCHPFMQEHQIEQVEEFLKAHKQYEY